MTIITDDDLPQSVIDDIGDDATLTLMLAGANASAGRVAPCLVASGDDAPTEGQLAEAKLVLLSAITRWSQAGASGLTTVQQGAGPFQQTTTTDTRQRTGYRLWPSEIEQLQDICKVEVDSTRAYMIDMTGLPESSNPLRGAVINAYYGNEPEGTWAEQ